MTNKILVFGKTGQIGSELQKFPSVISIGRKDANFLNPKDCFKIIKEVKPAFVINAAAFTDVEECETEKEKSFIINSVTPGEIAKICNIINASLIHISTEYVFDGLKKSPYLTNDNCNPINHYGKTKFLGEQNIKKNTSNFIILRTSWVFSKNSNNFVKKIIDISKNKSSIKVVNDQVGGPTYAVDIARALIDIVDKSKIKNVSGIYNYSGYPDVSRNKFALEILRYANKKIKVEITNSEKLQNKAKRPINSRLNCFSTKKNFNISRPLWKDGLANIFK